jgi:spermidine/putrescine transport system permease protein
VASTAGTAPLAVTEPDHGRKRGRTGYLLLLPAAIWLGLFFVVPFYSLVATSLFDPSGSDSRGYEMTYHVANYWNAFQDYKGPLLRSLPSRSRPGAGRT